MTGKLEWIGCTERKGGSFKITQASYSRVGGKVTPAHSETVPVPQLLFYPLIMDDTSVLVMKLEEEQETKRLAKLMRMQKQRETFEKMVDRRSSVPVEVQIRSLEAKQAKLDRAMAVTSEFTKGCAGFMFVGFFATVVIYLVVLCYG